MSKDYEIRKQAKKVRKRLGRENREKQGVPKRQRLKKNAPRRLCTGVCYQKPELNPEDKKWNGKLESDSEPEVEMEAAEGSSPEAIPVASPPAHSPAEKKTKPTKEKTAKLSTGVHLLRATQQQEAAPASASLRPTATGPIPQALEAFHPIIQQHMVAQGYLEPTPIQEKCWPLACDGLDVQGVAEPGSGKTLGYLLPGAVRLHSAGHGAASRPEGPLMLLLVPTRELALQVAGEARAMSRLTGLRTVCVHGGVAKEGQIEALSKQPHILVATPGRCLDLVDSGVLTLRHVSFVVLDEADKMLSIGFRQQLERLRGLLLPAATAATPSEPRNDVAGDAVLEVPQPQHDSEGAEQQGKVGGKGKKRRHTEPVEGRGATPVSAKDGEKQTPAPQGKKKRQREAVGGGDGAGTTGKLDDPGAAAGMPAASRQRPQVLLFTATMPEEVEAAAVEWMGPQRRQVTVTTSALSISRTVTQVVQVCAEHKKPRKLLKHLMAVREAGQAQRNPPRVLVFTNRIKTARFVFDTVEKEGFKVGLLHGERSQQEREEAIRAFRSGKLQVLVATDVAARGLDIRNLPYVVNYDFPSRLESYIHRVGRTGRLAATGHAFSFFTRNLARIAPPLVELLKQHEQMLDPNLVQLAEAWQIAVEKVGADAAEAAAGPNDLAGGLDILDAMLEVEDLQEGLGPLGVSGTNKRKKRKTQADEGAAGDAVVPVAEAAKRKTQAPVAAFTPAKKFSGVRKGCVFKLGDLGLGYYKDTPPAHRKGLPAHKQPVFPTQRSRAAQLPDSSDEDDDSPQPSTSPKRTLEQGRKGKPQKHATGKPLSHSDWASDSDTEEPGSHGGKPAIASLQLAQAKAGGNRHRALPGRLRKKLAKDRVRQAGKAP